MPTAFKSVAIVGKSDPASLPDILDQLSAVLRERGLRIAMDPATAGPHSHVVRTGPEAHKPAW